MTNKIQRSLFIEGREWFDYYSSKTNTNKRDMFKHYENYREVIA